jgi:hypothetical protein
MAKLKLDPAQGSYSGKLGAESIAVQSAGGASRYRRDQLGAAAIAEMEWVLEADAYDYFMAFYRSSTEHGSSPFTLDAILNKAAIAEYTAYFVPGSIALAGVRGTAFVVTANLEILPLAENHAADLALIAAWEAAH